MRAMTAANKVGGHVLYNSGARLCLITMARGLLIDFHLVGANLLVHPDVCCHAVLALVVLSEEVHKQRL